MTNLHFLRLPVIKTSCTYFQIPTAFAQRLNYIVAEIVRKPRGGAHLVAGYEV